MAIYLYEFHEERGEFDAFVEDINGKDVWRVHYPDFYEDEVSGEIIESNTIFDDGFMKDVYDIDGLEKYLKSLNIIGNDDKVYFRSEYNEDEEQGEETPNFAKGGALETKLKKLLLEKQSFDLPLEMAVYVPSTEKANQIIPKRDFTKRIEEVQVYLSQLFGGFSSVDVEGGYESSEKGLIQEDVTKVVAFANQDGFEDKFNQLMKKIVSWCKDWSQESIGFEFEGDLFYVSENAKFKRGGGIFRNAIHTYVSEGQRDRKLVNDTISKTRRGLVGYADGGVMAKGGGTKVDNKILVNYAQTESQREVLLDIIPILNKKGIKLRYSTSVGKHPQTIIFDKEREDGILRISWRGYEGEYLPTFNDEEFSDQDEFKQILKSVKFADGGVMAKGKIIPKKEYIVWGIPPKQKYEEPLVTDLESLNEANNYCKLLTEKYGCKNCRVQELDLSGKVDFSKMFAKTIKKSDGGVMAKGGITEHGLRVGDKIVGGKIIGTTIRVHNVNLDEDARVDLNTGKRTILTYNKKTKKWVDKMADGGMMEVRMEDTVQRMDDPNFADPSYYAEGGDTDSNTYEKVKVTIRDVDMGGDVIYSNAHWFRVDQLAKKTNKEIGDYILKKYMLDYGNTYKYSVVRTGETKKKMSRGGDFEVEDFDDDRSLGRYEDYDEDFQRRMRLKYFKKANKPSSDWSEGNRRLSKEYEDLDADEHISPVDMPYENFLKSKRKED